VFLGGGCPDLFLFDVAFDSSLAKVDNVGLLDLVSNLFVQTPTDARSAPGRVPRGRTNDQLEAMAAFIFSWYTNDRDYHAVVRLLFALLHARTVHQRAVQRKRLEWLTRGIAAVDQTDLELTRSVVFSDEFVGDDEHPTRLAQAIADLSCTVSRVWTVNTSTRLVQL
jgi:hypothetical protein